MNETLQSIQKLRSIRSFTEQPIKQEDLESILNASIRAANSSSRQCYSIIVLKDPEKMQTVCGYRGAVTLVYCVDYNRLNDIAAYLDEKNIMTAPIAFITGSTDAILAAQTAVIAAKSLGMDSLITNGVHRQDFDKVYQLLELPSKNCFPLVAVVIGYSDVPEGDHIKERRKNGVIHYETYHHLTEDEMGEEINYFDTMDKKDGSTMLTGWEQAGFSHYYNWFFQKWIVLREDTFTKVLKSVEFFK